MKIDVEERNESLCQKIDELEDTIKTLQIEKQEFFGKMGENFSPNIQLNEALELKIKEQRQEILQLKQKLRI